jgi:hypothetical protein
MDHGPEGPFGVEMTDAWRAVMSLHGDDGDDWQDMDSDDVELKSGGVITDGRRRTEPGPPSAS